MVHRSKPSASGPGGQDLTETGSSFLWVLLLVLETRQPWERGGMRQAWATQASVHVPGNTASERQLTALGSYGNRPPLPIILWSKHPARLSKPHQ